MKMTVPSVETLLFAVHIATIQAAFDASGTFPFRDPERPEPPSYEEAF